jgi:hypothetical protein
MWLTSHRSHFTHRERKPGMHWIGGLMGLRVSLDDLENRIISFSSPLIKLIPWLPSPYPGSYAECVLLSKPLLQYFVAQIFGWVEWSLLLVICESVYWASSFWALETLMSNLESWKYNTHFLYSCGTRTLMNKAVHLQDFMADPWCV